MTTTDTAAQPATVFDETQVQLSRVYSDALLAAAQKGGALEEVVTDIAGVGDLFQANRGLLEGLIIGSKSTDETDALIVKAFGGKVHQLVLNLLRLLNGKSRLSLVPALADRVKRDSDRLLGRCRVRVVSVRELTSEQSQTLSRQLQERLGLMPVLEHSVDPSLIGGLVIRVGDLQFDSSIRSRLEQLRKNLLEGKIHEIQSRRDQLHTSA